MVIPPLTLSQLTEGGVTGDGAFDVLMQTMRAHLEVEYTKNRIRGPEYAQVYLTSLQAVLQQATLFLLSKDKAAYEAELVAAQVELAKQQAANALIEGQNLVLQGELLAAQKENLDVERALTQAKTGQTLQETENLTSAKLQIEAQTLQTAQQTENLVAAKTQTIAQTTHLAQQTANAVIEGTVLTAQKCKLDAEYDLTVVNVTKSGTENSLLAQKVVSERAQTQALGVDPDSVIGKQKNLYQAQTDGFQRDAEQKAAKLMVDSWNIRRTTDESTGVNATNMLEDSVVGRAVSKMLTGVGA